MRTLVIVPTIRTLENFSAFAEHFPPYTEIAVIDEGDSACRKINSKILESTDFDFALYGPEERIKLMQEWGLKEFIGVIPEKCHAEISFGLVIAAVRKEFDMVVFLDDDVLPLYSFGNGFLEKHWENLNRRSALVVDSDSSWVSHCSFYPRGFPYCQRKSDDHIALSHKKTNIVLSQGLWEGVPDLSSIDYFKFLSNWPTPSFKDFRFSYIAGVTAKNKFTTVCSMNMAFKPKIIPALYQIPAIDGHDRFDDIWGGIFLKKIADRLDDDLFTGSPIVYHSKSPRNLMSDLRKEILGLEINEFLYEWLTDVPLDGALSYISHYEKIVDSLAKKIGGLDAGEKRTYLARILGFMKGWCDMQWRIEELF